MSVPHRQLYRVVFSKEIAIVASRMGFLNAHRPLYPNIPYVMTGLFYERMKDVDPKAVAELLPPRPITKDTQRLLVFFPGGIGDVICLNAAVREYRRLNPQVTVAVIATSSDKALLDPETVLWDYPVTETVANHYDSWVNIGELHKDSVGQELTVTFAEYLGVEAPETFPRMKRDEALACAMASYIRDPKRILVGVQLASACHYRSIPTVLGTFAMLELVKRGCDCYILGVPKDKIAFKNNGEFSEPPHHIYDMTAVLGPMEATIAFASLMDVVVTPDTGTLHIAGALGVPTVGLFGVTGGETRTRYYPSLRVMQGQAECSPCYKLAVDVPCDKPWCEAMMSFEPEEIADKVMEVYSENAEVDGIE